MTTLPVDPATPDHAIVARAAGAIRRGELVVFPTDTFYGIGADPWNIGAVQRLFAVKGRPDHKPIPLIASDRAQVERVFGALSAEASRLAQAFWPGPLAILLPAPQGIAPAVHAETRTVAVRVPDAALARALAAASGGLITATSANASGASPVTRAADAVASLRAPVGLALDGGETPGGLPSTIVDVSGGVRLVRAGALSWDRVQACLK